MNEATKGERFNAAKHIYNQILEALENGVAIWRQPWVDCDRPRNAVTGRVYRGYNLFYLNAVASVKKYPTNKFLTYKQAADLGGHVRKGERGYLIAFMERKMYVEKAKDGTAKIDEHGKPLYRAVFISRCYTVFNVAQCENLPAKYYENAQLFENDPVKSAEAVVDNYIHGNGAGIEIVFGGDTACYVPNAEIIHMPEFAHFRTADGYYATLFHEIVHSTGSARRLDRDMKGTFGTASYAAEELIAEIGSSILCNDNGIDNIEQNAAYCESWLTAIKGMKETALMSAFTKAYSAVECVYNEKSASENKVENETAA